MCMLEDNYPKYVDGKFFEKLKHARDIVGNCIRQLMSV